nr:MAG TPA: tail protein-type pyocin [Caudoviricetes sp.]
MARINSYKKTDNVDDSDVFIIDSTSGNNGTRTVLWSTIKRIFTNMFAAKTHRHDAHDIDGTLSVDRLPTVPITKGGTGATTVDGAREALNAAVKNHGHAVSQIVGSIGSATVLAYDANLDHYITAEKAGYYIGPNGNRITGKPGGVDNFGFYVLKTGTNGNTSVIQMLIGSNQQLYLRMGWRLGEGWKRLVNDHDVVNNAHHAERSDNDGSNQNIANTYIKAITVNGTTVTVKRGNNSTYTFNTQDTRYQIADDVHDGLMSARMHQTSQWAYERYLEMVDIVNHDGAPALRFRNGAAVGPHPVTYIGAANNDRSGIMARDEWRFLHTLKTVDQSRYVPDNADLNDYRGVGWYTIKHHSNGLKNMPVSGKTFATLLVLKNLDHEVDQVFIATMDAHQRSGRQCIFVRHYGSGGSSSWSPWQDITAYPSATHSADGLMTAADKRKLDGLSGDYGGSIGLATSSKDGLMAKGDKAKLDAAKTINNVSYLQSGADFNDIKTVGYYSVRWTESGSMHNKPFTHSATGMLVVFSSYNNSDSTQLFISNKGFTRIRTYNSGGTLKWSSWTGLDDNESISTGAIDAMFNI